MFIRRARTKKSFKIRSLKRTYVKTARQIISNKFSLKSFNDIKLNDIVSLGDSEFIRVSQKNQDKSLSGIWYTESFVNDQFMFLLQKENNQPVIIDIPQDKYSVITKSTHLVVDKTKPSSPPFLFHLTHLDFHDIVFHNDKYYEMICYLVNTDLNTITGISCIEVSLDMNNKTCTYQRYEKSGMTFMYNDDCKFNNKFVVLDEKYLKLSCL